MLNLIEDEIKRVKQLRDKAKFEEALDLIQKLEENNDLLPQNNLDCQVLKGEIFYWLGQYSEALEIFEHAHQESQRIGTVTQTFDSLIWKLCTLANLEETDHFHKEIVVAEELFKSLPKESSKEFDRRKVLYNWVKGVESILRYEFRKGVEINMVNLGLIRHCIHSMHHDGFL